MSIRVALILALTALPSCSSQLRHASELRHASQQASQEIFDEQSASTLSVVAKPLVFARERSDVAAHSRDYATLVAVEDDRSGETTHFLLLYRWSTVDRRMSPPPAPDAGQLWIQADGRVLELKPLEKMPISLEQRRPLHVPDHGDVTPHAYRVDLATLSYIATSREIIVRLPQEQLDSPFTLFEDGRPSLAQFLQRVGGP